MDAELEDGIGEAKEGYAMWMEIEYWGSRMAAAVIVRTLAQRD